MKATDLLKQQHREVKSLFREAKKADVGERRGLLDEIEQKLRHHMEIEEGIFYPAVRSLETKKTDEIVPEAYEEHHVVKLVLDELPDYDVEDERFEAKMTVLEELIEHHVEEEETDMFKAAARLGNARLEELAEEMQGEPAEGEDEESADDEEEDEEEDDAEETDEEDAERAEVAPPARGARGGRARR